MRWQNWISIVKESRETRVVITLTHKREVGGKNCSPVGRDIIEKYGAIQVSVEDLVVADPSGV